jgi:hypothetical protein
MRKVLLALVAAVLLVNVVSADEAPQAYFNLGQVDFVIPLTRITATPWLYDVLNSRASMAAETVLVSFPRKEVKVLGMTIPVNSATFSAGAQTSERARFTPIGSIGFDFGKIITNAPAALTNFGIWIGHDFRSDNPNNVRIITDAGIKASVPIELKW